MAQSSSLLEIEISTCPEDETKIDMGELPLRYRVHVRKPATGRSLITKCLSIGNDEFGYWILDFFDDFGNVQFVFQEAVLDEKGEPFASGDSDKFLEPGCNKLNIFGYSGEEGHLVFDFRDSKDFYELDIYGDIDLRPVAPEIT